MSKTLAIYLMSGPDTPELAEAAVEGGADLVELGFPFSDPLADGPVIRRAAEKALAQGMRTQACLECLAAVRERVDVPLVPMTYSSLLEAYGWDRFAEDARSAGAASLIVADLPAGDRPGLRRVQLVAPTSTDERLRLAAARDGRLALPRHRDRHHRSALRALLVARRARRARAGGRTRGRALRRLRDLDAGRRPGRRRAHGRRRRRLPRARGRRGRAGARCATTSARSATRSTEGETYPESASAAAPAGDGRDADPGIQPSSSLVKIDEVVMCRCAHAHLAARRTPMGKIEPLAPSKRVRIVLCSATLAIAAIAPGRADWSSDQGSRLVVRRRLAGRRLVVEQARAEGRLVVEQAGAEGRLVVEPGSLRRPTGALATGRARSASGTPPNGGRPLPDPA